MPRPAPSQLLIAAALAAAGCSSTIRYPKLRGPGPAAYQRGNAEAFDPYPLPDLGPPIVGGRPREFSLPRNVVERAQDYSIVQAARRGLPAGPPLTGAPISAAPLPSAAPPFVPTTPPAPIYAAPPPMPSVPSGQPSIRY